MKLSLEEIRSRVAAALDRSGFAPEHVATISEVIVAAERDGAKSHGIYRLAGCLRTVRAGHASPTAMPEIIDDGSPIIRVSAGGGFGCTAFAQTAPRLAERAAEFGLAALAINDAAHFFALWYEVELMATLGTAAIAMLPSYPTVAPAGGRAPLLGTNPFAFGWPRPSGHPYVFDFATSQSARGEVELRLRAGEPLPPGWAIDSNGEPTTDPVAALDGALLPFGGYKGSALSTMIELLGGALIGDRTSPTTRQEFGEPNLTPTHGELIIAFNIDRFTSDRTRDANQQAESLFADIKEQGARLPSERRYAARRIAEVEGVELDESEIAALDRLARDGLAAV